MYTKKPKDLYFSVRSTRNDLRGRSQLQDRFNICDSNQYINH